MTRHADAAQNFFASTALWAEGTLAGLVHNHSVHSNGRASAPSVTGFSTPCAQRYPHGGWANPGGRCTVVDAGGESAQAPTSTDPPQPRTALPEHHGADVSVPAQPRPGNSNPIPAGIRDSAVQLIAIASLAVMEHPEDHRARRGLARMLACARAHHLPLADMADAAGLDLPAVQRLLTEED